LLAGDWVSFDFSYALDMRRLIPHIAAIEEYRAAALTRVLPPRWLEASQGLDPVDAADEGTAPPPAMAAKQLPVRDTSVARAWVERRFARGSAPLSLADILSIHGMVAEQSGIHHGSAGALRTLPVKVGRAAVGGLHLGAPAEELPQLMDRYVEFIDSPALRSLPPVIHALLAHFFFDTIHPFLDGNGRTSRLVAAAILCQHGYNLHGTYALVRHFYRHEIRYHTILHRSWKRCPFDVTPFVAFGMEGFVTELKSVDSFIKMKLNRIVDPDLRAPAFGDRIGARST
jgi:Fic/DOC family